MIIIGERINSSRRSISQAVETCNPGLIREEAIRQAEAGADYIDVNTGTFLEKEAESLQWLVGVVQEATGKPLCIDTVNPHAAAAALKLHKGRAILNSISAETERYRNLLPLVKEYGCRVVASCLDSSGIPETAEGRVRVAVRLIEGLTSAGVPVNDIFIDPLVQPISVDNQSVIKVLESIEKVKKNYPAVRTVCGVSNVSFGLPARSKLNQTLLALAMLAGLDAAIVDPLDAELMATLVSTNTLLGRDEYCADYVRAYRGGRLGCTR